MSDTPSQREYSVVPASTRTDRASVVGLWRRGELGDPAQLDARFQWYHCDHPSGPSTLLFLCCGPDHERVGVAGLGQRRMYAAGRSIAAGVLADLVVLQEHRTLYPALLLEREMCRVGLESHSILYGLPNDKSAPVVRRLGFVQIGELVRYVAVLRYGEYLKRWLPEWLAAPVGSVMDLFVPWYLRSRGASAHKWRTAWLTSVDQRFDTLWFRAKEYPGIIGRRDSRFLAWRFFAQPGRAHRVFALSRASDDQLMGYAMCEHGGYTLHVRDFLVDPAAERLVPVLLARLAREAAHEGYSSISLHFLGDPRVHRLIAAAGMAERERNAVLGTFAEKDRAQLQSLDWYLTRADMDV